MRYSAGAAKRSRILGDGKATLAEYRIKMIAKSFFEESPEMQ